MDIAPHTGRNWMGMDTYLTRHSAGIHPSSQQGWPAVVHLHHFNNDEGYSGHDAVNFDVAAHCTNEALASQ